MCPVNESKTPWITILTRSSPLLCDMILLFTIYNINYAYIRYLERNFWIYIKPFVFSILNLLTWQCLVIKLYSKIKFIFSCCAVIGCSKCRGFQHEFDIIWVLFTLFDTTDHESTHDSLLPVRKRMESNHCTVVKFKCHSLFDTHFPATNMVRN